MPQMNAAQLNAFARAAINAQAVERTQLLNSTTLVPANTPQLTINPRNVGLIRGFWVQVIHTVHNGSGVQIDLTDFGPANALAQIQFNDLNNITRIQTPGWHLHFSNSCKARRPFGTAFVRGTGIDTPIDYGSNFIGQISAPASIAAGQDGTLTMWYWVPLAYSQTDLRGAVYANVVNSTMQLIFSMPGTFGIQPAVQSGTDSTLALYVGHAAGSVAAVTLSSTTIVTYQVYMDQLPTDPKLGVLLPIIDLATIYELKQTTQQGIVANQDFNYQYANFRDFLSTFVVYVNNGTTGARGVGGDINYWALQSANASNIWKMTPDLIALKTRNYLGCDLPPGCYYFGSREKPINTVQYGNMQLTLNALTATNTPVQLVGVEDFALQQTLTMAGSLASQ